MRKVQRMESTIKEFLKEIKLTSQSLSKMKINSILNLWMKICKKLSEVNKK